MNNIHLDAIVEGLNKACLNGTYNFTECGELYIHVLELSKELTKEDKKEDKEEKKEYSLFEKNIISSFDPKLEYAEFPVIHENDLLGNKWTEKNDVKEDKVLMFYSDDSDEPNNDFFKQANQNKNDQNYKLLRSNSDSFISSLK